MDLLILQAGGGSTGIMNLLFPVLIIVVFYFFMIRPQQKKQKDQLNFQANLAKGDKIVTAGGVLGVVTKVDEKFITLQTDTKSYLRITRGSVSKELTEGLGTEAIDW